MNVLILGSGGREYTLAWKIAQSTELSELFIAPGNGGTADFGQNVDLGVGDFEAIAEFILANNIDLVVVGPEAPLVNGLTDFLAKDSRTKQALVIGPGKDGAQLEGSKAFSKEFMARHDIPTAQYKTFTAETLKEGQAFIDTLNSPYVLKADGLAGGKGVLIIEEKQTAKAELENMFSGKFGEASETVVIEEFLEGIELSVFALTDGENYVMLPEAKDYKRIGEGDQGLNTGGMGAVSPVPFASAAFMDKVEDRIVKPTIEGLKKEGIPYCGFLFVGLMNVNGDPFVIEYNVRMGDPETEVVLPRIKSDLLPFLIRAASGKLNGETMEFTKSTAVTVMTVSGGYPESYEKGKIMDIRLENTEDLFGIHAGTKHDGNNIVTSGGRVLSVTAIAESLPEAIKKAYQGVSQLSFDKMFFRSDIGKDLL